MYRHQRERERESSIESLKSTGISLICFMHGTSLHRRARSKALPIWQMSQWFGGQWEAVGWAGEHLADGQLKGLFSRLLENCASGGL